LDWIRDETPDDSVVAVNNQWIDPGNQAPLEFIYSAFTERRVFLEGWGYSQRTRELGLTGTAGGANPFQDRLDLNEAAFDGDAHALETLARDYGVRYLIVDRLNGTPVDLDALRRSARVVYDVPEAVVFELPAA
jgi:hypothetical protein